MTSTYFRILGFARVVARNTTVVDEPDQLAYGF